jgi:hypothetical protein
LALNGEKALAHSRNLVIRVERRKNREPRAAKAMVANIALSWMFT